MNIEIINVGTELLLGEIVNTNAACLLKMCKELGFDVYYQSVVGDNPERFLGCLKTAFERGADCVITTGGLGPTEDDLTKELSAQFLGLEMERREEEVIKVKDKCTFVTRSSVIPSNNFKQADFPKGCKVLDNEVGTANGCVMENHDQMIINLPGPPKELKYVVEHELMPYLSKYKKDVLYTEDILTMGLSESKAASLLNDLIQKQEDVTIALYASEETVRIRLGCKADSKEHAYDQIKLIKEEIEKRCEKFIIHENFKTTFEKIHVSYKIIYHSDFRFRDSYLNHSVENGELVIHVNTIQHSLGEILKVHLKDSKHSHTFELGLLKKAELNYEKLEAKIYYQLVRFIRQTRGLI